MQQMATNGQFVFKSYQGSLDSFDAIPQETWSGIGARLGVRRPAAKKAI